MAAGPVEPRPEPPRRRTPLPSLAELGAFDGAPPPAKPRLTGRLGEADLKGKPEEPLARPKEGRSWHADTPFETVKTAEGVLLKREADAGWIDPDAAHALWARWLARKPLTHVEDDATPMPPRRTAPPAGESAPGAAPPETVAAAAGQAEAEGVAPQATPAAEQVTQPLPGPESIPVTVPIIDTVAEPVAEPVPGPAPKPVDGSASETVDETAPAAPAPKAAEAPAQPSGPPPERPGVAQPPEPEVLMPSHEYEAHRAAERAFNRPTVEVVEVLEVPSLNPVRPPAPSWVAGQFALALLSAVAAALSIGLGSTLFGAWGACVAAAGCTALGWHRTAAFHAQGQGLRALLGAHLTIGLAAVTIWQWQVAMGWWPQARPMDLFADAVSRPAAPSLQLDWRWLSLAGLTLAVAMVWLIRLRRPVLLASVTALAWAVAFQVVAGVLQSLGLSMQLMDGFMPMLGAMTLAAAVYVDLVSRRADVADYARWPYLLAAALLAAGWLSAALMPLPVQVLRGVALLAFLALAMSLQRPGMMAIALAAAAFEAAWTLGRTLGSPWIGGAAWLAGLALTGAGVAFIAPRLPRWSRPLQFWMPAEWRSTLRIQRREGTQHTVLKGRRQPR